MSRRPAFEVLGRRHVCRYRRNSAKAGRSFEPKTKRHMTATGNAGRKHAPWIDTDFGDDLVDHRRQEPHVVNVELVRAVVTDNVARVPIAFVPIGIDDCKSMFVGKALGEDLKDPTLKQYFLTESLKRASFRGDLETALHQNGVHDVKESGTMGGTIRRTWGDLKAKVGGSDHTLLETAESGEDAAKKAYKEALDKELPLLVHEMLSTQYAHIQTSHDYVKAARDSRK